MPGSYRRSAKRIDNHNVHIREFQPSENQPLLIRRYAEIRSQEIEPALQFADPGYSPGIEAEEIHGPARAGLRRSRRRFHVQEVDAFSSYRPPSMARNGAFQLQRWT